MTEDLKRIEAVLDEKVRPALRAHGGEIEIDRLEDGVLYVKLLGQCAGCAAADLTTELLIQEELLQAVPGLIGVELVCPVSDELLRQARSILSQSHGG